MDAAFLRGNALVGIPTKMQVSHGTENLPGQYAKVTGTPARFILRIGWAETVATGAGVPCDFEDHASWVGSSQPVLHARNPPSNRIPSIVAGGRLTILLLRLLTSPPEPRANSLR